VDVVERVDCVGVVVGDDGSEPAGRALRWALDYAVARDRPLAVVRAWTFTTAPRPEGWIDYVPSMREIEDTCREKLRLYVASELPADIPVPVELHVVHGRAAQVLADCSTGAELLVIGWRGRGGIRDWLLGSTAEEVVRRARCPVVVVRPRELDTSGAAAS
jgi:nucleotide-binding universal stress UspA family protein